MKVERGDLFTKCTGIGRNGCFLKLSSTHAYLGMRPTSVTSFAVARFLELEGVEGVGISKDSLIELSIYGASRQLMYTLRNYLSRAALLLFWDQKGD